MSLRRYIEIVESAIRLEGFWIDERGEMLACDHARDWHHADIALAHFPQEPDADGDGEFDEGDTAIAEARGAGWIKGSYVVGKELVIAWGGAGFGIDARHPSRAARETLLDWIVAHGAGFPRVRLYVRGVEHVFEDIGEALADLRRRL